MDLPIMAPAPVVAAHAGVCRALVDHQGPFRHCQPSLTGRLVLPKKSLAHSARGIRASTDTTHLSRLRSEAPGREDTVKRAAAAACSSRPSPIGVAAGSRWWSWRSPRCAPVGRRFAAGDRHDHHREGPDRLAHHPITSVSGSGAVRFPRGLRRYRRDEELTPWAAALAQHVPELPLPRAQKARHRRQQQVDPLGLQAPEVRARHAQFRTKMALASARVAEASRGQGPVGVGVCDAWSLAADVVRGVARRRQDWSSRRTQPRGLATASVQRRDGKGGAMKRPGPHLAVETRVPRLPATASRPGAVGGHTDWGCTLRVRSPGLGKVRIVVRCADEVLTGRSVVRVTHRVDGSAAKRIGLALHRWPTATFYQDRQGPLGGHKSRRRRTAARGQQWCVGCVASALWHVTCRPAGPDRTPGLLHTLGAAGRQPGRALMQHLLGCVPDRLLLGLTLDQVLAGLLAMPRGMVPP